VRTETVYYRPETEEGRDFTEPPREFSLPSPGILVRAARQASNLRLDDVARDTRISLRNLEALEEDRYSDLPAESFVRGYLKILARRLGEDEALWLAAYDDCAQTRVKSSEVEESDWSLPASGFRLRAFTLGFRISTVFAVVLAIIAFFLIYFALEGGSAKQTTTAERPEGSLIKMLDMRPVQRN